MWKAAILPLDEIQGRGFALQREERIRSRRPLAQGDRRISILLSYQLHKSGPWT